jgi:sucrose phosphatase-like protein
MSRRLLASDLDGTLVGDPPALAHLNRALSRLRPQLSLAYVTGRSLSSTLTLIAEAGLLEPDVIVSGVGTGIHWAPYWRVDEEWQRRLKGAWSVERIRAVAAFFPDLEAQPPEGQGPFKCSYFLSGPCAAEILSMLKATLRRHRLSTRLVYSSRRDLDIVPLHGGKGNAVRHVAEKLRIPLHSVVCCGDSGNDADMLGMGGGAVVVANAQPELGDQAIPRGYFARAGHAAGVHEGLIHYGWLTSRTD